MSELKTIFDMTANCWEITIWHPSVSTVAHFTHKGEVS